VEFVIQDYGMRSVKGRAGAYMRGYARMFKINGRSEIWRRPFQVDRVVEGAEHLDPFKVGKDPSLFRQELTGMLDVVAAQFAEELRPTDRKPGAPPPPEGDSVHGTGRELPAPPKPPERDLAPGELPDP